jgi:hypothetical protein
LKRQIENWSISIDLESIDDHQSLMIDSIQTAEAFRWSTLCSPYQTVPELPNQTSYEELTQKISVYLATVPLSSPTPKIHFFPLIVAGADAVEEEDREFVRERSKAVSQRLAKSSVSRCLDVTEEVWEGRDKCLLLQDPSRPTDLHQFQQSTNESPNHDMSNPSSHSIGSSTASGPGIQSMQYLAGVRHGFTLGVALY